MNSLVGRTSVVIPALNEETTVAAVVRHVLAENPFEVLVIDSDSVDRTAEEAARAGARVVNWREILPDLPPQPGKGEALWRGVAAAQGEFVVFVDADLIAPPAQLVSALVTPCLNPDIHLVKACYRRTMQGQPTGGGRVTELTAKPLLRMFFPELAGIEQPLGGEYAIRRSVAMQLPFTEGYGVEMGLLLDTAAQYGAGAIAQVDVGERSHRNRPLEDLVPMADIVARTVLSRATEDQLVVERPHERPPLATL